MSKSVAEHCQERALSLDELHARTGLETTRLMAIVEGRWTPSPHERERIASVFAVTVDDISWGHKTPIQHLWGHGPT
jgi:hypothetical protein